VFFKGGIPTILVDTSQEALEGGRKSIAKALDSGVKRGMMTPDQAKGIQLLVSTTLDYDDLKDCDLIIEAVFERMDIKEAIFKQLGEVVKEGAPAAPGLALLAHSRQPDHFHLGRFRSGHRRSRGSAIHQGFAQVG